ncbi:hypothetical protein DFH28DRAFT_912497 [Melampsora americana]|nr:hypothetical protein DFH28DRAFT_912497 [Melampsora americana]
MALGLGQNWSRVRRVIHVGRGDPSCIEQMFGRCGRDGRPGLAILLVEENRRSGKNRIQDFNPNVPQSDDDRMDALGITTVCLRVAFCVDNWHGYIPLLNSDPIVISEKQRQASLGMPVCQCSNCDPLGAEILISNQKYLTTENFDEVMKSSDCLAPENTTDQHNSSAMPHLDLDSIMFDCSASDPIRTDLIWVELANLFKSSFDELFYRHYGTYSDLIPSLLFPTEKAWLLTKNFSQLLGSLPLDSILASEPIKGTYNMIFEIINRWKNSSAFALHQVIIEAEIARWKKAFADKAMRAWKRKLSKKGHLKQKKVTKKRKMESETLTSISQEPDSKSLDESNKEDKKQRRETAPFIKPKRAYKKLNNEPKASTSSNKKDRINELAKTDHHETVDDQGGQSTSVMDVSHNSYSKTRDDLNRPRSPDFEVSVLHLVKTSILVIITMY